MADNMDVVKVDLTGRIDSNNASEMEKKIFDNLTGKDGCAVEIDASTLEYISSAGLRVLLHLKKSHPELRITGVSSEVYEILDMTGFTEMMTVEKAYRVISVEGCEVIGEGANGKVYRIDQDNVVKTYKNADALSEIQHEREVAKTALILGVPTAISYDVVKVGDSYGSVFELLDAKSFAKILAEEPDKMDWCVDEYVIMLRNIHDTVVPEGKLPHIKEVAMGWLRGIKDDFSGDLEEAYSKLEKLLNELPDRGTMIHGDYHTKNIVIAGDEVLLIDMDTLSVGHPIFELAQMYNSYLGFSEYDPSVVEKFQGFSRETSEKFWNAVIKKYLGTEDDAFANEVIDKARVLGYIRLIDWNNRHSDLSDPSIQGAMKLWKGELIDLAGKVDNLDFSLEDLKSVDGGDYSSAGKSGNEIEIDATLDNLPVVMEFVESKLEGVDCSKKSKMHIDIAVEEVFVNIANYAYAPGVGEVKVRVDVREDPVVITITFMDQGVPYDPLAKEDPDVKASAEDRDIGGLGIFMTKNSMDDVTYEYKDGSNILTLVKNL